MDSLFYDKLIHVLEEERIYTKEPMKKHTTFRVGGEADYFVLPKTTEEVKGIVAL